MSVFSAPRPTENTESEVCRHCKGKGKYIVKEVYGDGDECLVPYECTHCDGTGVAGGTREDEDFDIDGNNNDD